MFISRCVIISLVIVQGGGWLAGSLLGWLAGAAPAPPLVGYHPLAPAESKMLDSESVAIAMASPLRDWRRHNSRPPSAAHEHDLILQTRSHQYFFSLLHE